jgi:hypothetical protein
MEITPLLTAPSSASQTTALKNSQTPYYHFWNSWHSVLVSLEFLERCSGIFGIPGDTANQNGSARTADMKEQLNSSRGGGEQHSGGRELGRWDIA